MAIQIHSYCMIPIDFWYLFCVKFSSLEHAMNTDHKMFLTSKLERQ